MSSNPATSRDQIQQRLINKGMKVGIDPVIAGGQSRLNMLRKQLGISPSQSDTTSSPSQARTNTTTTTTGTASSDVTPVKYSSAAAAARLFQQHQAAHHAADGTTPAFDINLSATTDDDDDTSSFLSAAVGGKDGERGALHKALSLSRQDNRALRSQIERMRAREMEIVSLGVQSQMQMTSASQQLESLKKRVRQELCHPVDEKTYQELIAKNESELNIFDTIRLSVYKQSGELQASRDRAVKELQDNAARYKDAIEFAQNNRYEMDQLVRQHNHDIATREDRIEILEQRCKGLEQAAKTAVLTLDANESKAARFDAVEAELKRANGACASATEERDRLSQKCSHLSSDLNQTRDELQRNNLLLNNAQTELKFQTREAERANSRLADRDSEIKRVTQQLDELRNSRTASGSVIGVEREELRASYEKQLDAATKRMKDGFETDLARVREMSKEASERECALLREARDSAASEVNRIRQQYTSLESDFNSLKEQTREKLDASEREVFELRIEVANLTNHGRRHDLAAQESAAEIQRLRTDRDCLQKKLDVLKQEFYDTRAAYQQQVTSLQSKLEAQEGQLEMFKSLETEAEVFMQHLAEASSSSEMNEVAGVRALLDVPSSRRAAHTISVTKRCLALENQVSLLKHEQGIAEIKFQKQGEELGRARGALQDTNSPYLLLEKALKDRDEQAQLLRDRLKITEEELSAAMRRAQLLAQDVQVLTAHRAEVLRLRDALRGLSGNQYQVQPSNIINSNNSYASAKGEESPNKSSSGKQDKKQKSSKHGKSSKRFQGEDDDFEEEENEHPLSQQQQQQTGGEDGFFEFHF